MTIPQKVAAAGIVPDSEVDFQLDETGARLVRVSDGRDGP